MGEQNLRDKIRYMLPHLGTKFEFKVVRVKKTGEVIWETLPNNSNRKFKPKCASQIQLEWSKPEGKVLPLTRGTFKVRGFPAVSTLSTIRSDQQTKKSREQKRKK